VKVLLLAVVLLAAVSGWAGELRLQPARVGQGGVVLLNYRGSSPTLAVARWNGRLVYLTPQAGGAVAMLGADLALPPGDYPLILAVTDPCGETQFLSANIEVVAVPRKEERLRLPEAVVSPRKPKVLARISREAILVRNLFGKESFGMRAERFSLPVNDPTGSGFGLRRILNGLPRSLHAGIDFRSPRGRTVRAAGTGRVVFAGDLFFTGRTVILDHGEGLYTLYAHLEKVICRVGQELGTSEPLGMVGSSGRATGPHLHWGARLRGDRIDPLALVALSGKCLDSKRAASNNEIPALRGE
jgi:murein DD-endopeptidase MepM/ murein hydrolase activator NlpD